MNTDPKSIVMEWVMKKPHRKIVRCCGSEVDLHCATDERGPCGGNAFIGSVESAAAWCLQFDAPPPDRIVLPVSRGNLHWKWNDATGKPLNDKQHGDRFGVLINAWGPLLERYQPGYGTLYPANPQAWRAVDAALSIVRAALEGTKP